MKTEEARRPQGNKKGMYGFVLVDPKDALSLGALGD
jgi:hypothetical protein